MTSLTRPLCILIRGTHAERKGERSNGDNYADLLLLVLTSVAQSTFLFIEFSTELINVVPTFDHINVGETMVRCHNNHFICAILIEKNGHISMISVRM